MQIRIITATAMPAAKVLGFQVREANKMANMFGANDPTVQAMRKSINAFAKKNKLPAPKWKN